MIRAGVPPHIAMSISGHKTDSMLRRYAIISEADQRTALRRTHEFRMAEAASSPQQDQQMLPYSKTRTEHGQFRPPEYWRLLYLTEKAGAP